MEGRGSSPSGSQASGDGVAVVAAPLGRGVGRMGLRRRSPHGSRVPWLQGKETAASPRECDGSASHPSKGFRGALLRHRVEGKLGKEILKA